MKPPAFPAYERVGSRRLAMIFQPEAASPPLLQQASCPRESRGFRRIGLQASAFSEEVDIGAEAAV